MCSLKHWLCWLLAPLLLFLPLLFIPQVMFFGNSDALFYTNILAMVTDALKSGELFPRWFGEANAGFGSPVMMFYAPLSYIITAFINLPLLFLHLGIGAQLLVGMYASQVVSGFTSFLWLKRHFTRRVAFAGSLLFVLLPYKLVYIYLHINLAQLWALAILPLWMMAAEDIAVGGRRSMGAYALALAGVYYTHPLTLIAFGAVPASQALWFGRRRLRPAILRLGAAHALGLGMCLMLALPQHYYLQWVHEESFFVGRLDWHGNLFHIDLFLCAYYGVIAALVAYAAARNRLPAAAADMKDAALFWATAIAAVVFMNLPVSAILWENLPLLKYLQFPAARLHAVALMGVTYLACVWLGNYKEMMPLGAIAYHRVTLAVLIVAFGIATALHIHHDYAHSEVGITADYINSARAAHIVIPPEYRTHWSCIESGKAYRLFKDKQVPPEVAFTSGSGWAAPLDWRPPAHIAFGANVKSESAGFMLRQCYFPLWRAQDEAGRNIPLTPGGEDGLLTLTLPRGAHEITLTLATTPMDNIATILAALSLLASLALLGFRRRG